MSAPVPVAGTPLPDLPPAAGSACPSCHKGTIRFSVLIHGTYSNDHAGSYITKCSYNIDPRSTARHITDVALNGRCNAMWITTDAPNMKPRRAGSCPPTALCGGSGQRNLACPHLNCQTCCHARILADETYVCSVGTHMAGPKTPHKAKKVASQAATPTGTPPPESSPIPPTPSLARPSKAVRPQVQPDVDTPHRHNLSLYFQAPADFVARSLGVPIPAAMASTRQAQLAEVREANKILNVTWYSEVADPSPRKFIVAAPNLPLFNPASSELLKTNTGVNLRQYSILVNNQWEGREVALTGLEAKQLLILGPPQLVGQPFIPAEEEAPISDQVPIASSSHTKVVSPSSDSEDETVASSGPANPPVPSQPYQSWAHTRMAGQRGPIPNSVFYQVADAKKKGLFVNNLDTLNLKFQHLGYIPSATTWRRQRLNWEARGEPEEDD
uniref:Uncharacterized protein n=1 Tax=Mycena chlorophos TaxID=658473 RepID=A0ABQ0L8P5_MYCCL|nr:predicted protein [Mycena chlorophos]